MSHTRIYTYTYFQLDSDRIVQELANGSNLNIYYIVCSVLKIIKLSPVFQMLETESDRYLKYGIVKLRKIDLSTGKNCGYYLKFLMMTS